MLSNNDTIKPVSALHRKNIHPLLALLVLLQMCTPAQSDLEIDPLRRHIEPHYNSFVITLPARSGGHSTASLSPPKHVEATFFCLFVSFLL